MAVNPVGYVALSDGSIPQAFTAKAGAALSGGQFVWVSGASASVSSGANSFAVTDLVAVQASGTWYPVGVVKQNAASGANVTIVTNNATLISTAAGTIVTGDSVYVASNDALTAVAAGSITDVILKQKVGKALTAAGSEGYCLFRLNCI